MGHFWAETLRVSILLTARVISEMYNEVTTLLPWGPEQTGEQCLLLTPT